MKQFNPFPPANCQYGAPMGRRGDNPANLRPVRASATRIYLRCATCGHSAPEVEFVADLHGRPFIDYYCPKCAQTLRALEGVTHA